MLKKPERILKVIYEDKLWETSITQAKFFTEHKETLW